MRSDADGVRTDDVERVFAEYRPRLFYVNPIAQNPTGAVLPARRAKQIVALARRYDVVILEDQTGWHADLRRGGAAAAGRLRHRRPRDHDGVASRSRSFRRCASAICDCKGAHAPMRSRSAKVRTDVFTSTLTQRALWRFMDGPATRAICARARAVSRAARRVRRRAGARTALGRRPPAAGRH